MRYVIHTYSLKHTLVDAQPHHLKWCIERLGIKADDLIAIEEYANG